MGYLEWFSYGWITLLLSIKDLTIIIFTTNYKTNTLVISVQLSLVITLSWKIISRIALKQLKVVFLILFYKTVTGSNYQDFAWLTSSFQFYLYMEFFLLKITSWQIKYYFVHFSVYNWRYFSMANQIYLLHQGLYFR